MAVVGSLHYGRGQPLATGTGWTGVYWGYLRSRAPLLWGQFVPRVSPLSTLACHTSSPASPCLSFPKRSLRASLCNVPVLGREKAGLEREHTLPRAAQTPGSGCT